MHKYKLKDLLVIKNGSDYRHLSQGNIPVYGSGGLMCYVNKPMSIKPSILLPRKGTLDNIMYVETPFWTVDTMYWTEVNDDIVEPYYLYNYLKVLRFDGIRSGSTLPSMTSSAYYDIPIVLPNYEKQKKIADILKYLDDKIELNSKINKELEQMAKTLYEYWFVQFDFPDEKGRPYKSANGKMVYNDILKREIPEGWEVKKLTDICNTYQPKTISDKELTTNGKYWVYGANGIIGRYNSYNHENSEIYITCRGASCGNVGRTLPQSWITGNAMIIQPKLDYMCNEYIYQYLKLINLQMIISGSAQPQITRTNLEILNIIVPTEETLDVFNKLIEPLITKRLSKLKENEELIQLRDFLLPLLMNGQVSVSSEH